MDISTRKNFGRLLCERDWRFTYYFIRIFHDDAGGIGGAAFTYGKTAAEGWVKHGFSEEERLAWLCHFRGNLYAAPVPAIGVDC